MGVVYHYISFDAQHVHEASLSQEVLLLLGIGSVGLRAQAHSLRCNVVLAGEHEEHWLVRITVNLASVEGICEGHLKILRAALVAFQMNKERCAFEVTFLGCFIIGVVFILLEPVVFHLAAVPKLEDARHVVLDTADLIHELLTGFDLVAITLVELGFVSDFVQRTCEWSKHLEQFEIHGAASVVQLGVEGWRSELT